MALPPTVVDKARVVLQNRVARLVRLLKLKAPDVILATEARLIGKAAWMLVPDYVATLDAIDHERVTREFFNVCGWSTGCDQQVVANGVCKGHAAAVNRMFASLDKTHRKIQAAKRKAKARRRR